MEAAYRKGAKLLGRGPAVAIDAIEEFLGNGPERVATLDALHLMRHPLTTDGKQTSTPAFPKAINIPKLKKLCGKVLKYAQRSVALTVSIFTICV